jgi:ADP-ribose pyrophosphatase YjhB (NUDIX family)
MREVEEEIGLKVVSSRYLFTHNDSEDKRIRNLHKVFLVKVKGTPKPDGHEVKHIAYWKPGSDINLSNTTRLLIEKYKQTSD